MATLAIRGADNEPTRYCLMPNVYSCKEPHMYCLIPKLYSSRVWPPGEVNSGQNMNTDKPTDGLPLLEFQIATKDSEPA